MKKKSIIAFLGLVAILIILAACSEAATQPEDPLAGTSWQLLFYRKTPVLEGTSITANFENGEINGSAGCNSYFGTYQVEEENLSFGQIGMTEMFCMEPEGVMEQEIFYLGALADAQHYEITNGRLTISLSGHETLTFKPAD